MRNWIIIGLDEMSDELPVVSLLFVTCFALLTGCYAHTPVKSARQLESGQLAASGQARLPGLAVIPGLAGVGQLGFGAGDVGAQLGTGYTNHYAGAMFALYPYDGITLGADGTYIWVPLKYEPASETSSWSDYDRDDGVAAGFEATFRGEYRWGTLYGGPRAQAVFWIPDPARSSDDALPEEARQSQFVGMTFGGVLGLAFRLSQNADFVIDGRYLPVVFDRGILSGESGTFVRPVPDIVFRNYGGPLEENRLQLTAGVSLHF